MALNPFDVIRDISSDKKGIITAENESEYNPFIVNRGLSYFRDTIYYANAMNLMPGLDKKLQFDFLLNSVRRSKRFSKWAKRDSQDIELIRKYYQCSYVKAREKLAILSKENLDAMTERIKQDG